MKQFIARFVVAMMSLVVLTTDLWACPSCKEGFRPGSAEAVAGEAFSASVMFMLIVPMLIVGSFAVVLVRKMKHENDVQVDKEEK